MRPLLVPAAVLAVVFAACHAENHSYGSGPDVDTADHGDTAEHNSASEAQKAQLRAMNAKLPKLGSQLPAIAALTMDGTRVDNDTLKGKTTLINLWFYH
jgi:cytochrome oxidase Cu insertion factor (SCO1/SenC/PrrC family)